MGAEGGRRWVEGQCLGSRLREEAGVPFEEGEGWSETGSGLGGYPSLRSCGGSGVPLPGQTGDPPQWHLREGEESSDQEADHLVTGSKLIKKKGIQIFSRELPHERQHPVICPSVSLVGHAANDVYFHVCPAKVTVRISNMHTGTFLHMCSICQFVIFVSCSQ